VSRLSAQRSSGGEQFFADVLLGSGHRVGTWLITISQAVGEDKLQVGDADETEQHFEQVFVTDAGRLADMQTTGSGNDDDFLAATQAFRAGFAVTEGTAGDRYAVDPGLGWLGMVKL